MDAFDVTKERSQVEVPRDICCFICHRIYPKSFPSVAGCPR